MLNDFFAARLNKAKSVTADSLKDLGRRRFMKGVGVATAGATAAAAIGVSGSGFNQAAAADLMWRSCNSP